MLVLVGLLALVYAVGIAVCYKLNLPRNLFIPVTSGFAVVIVFLQYIIGPYLLDAILSVRWSTPLELGADFAHWHQKTCSTFKITEPRLGVIEDQMPNAFTYGHGPWNGRVIITRGLMDVLTPDELKAVYAHELGHIKNRDFIMMTLVQALVLALYTLARSARFSSNRNLLPVMLASYAAYWLSYYVSLMFSRVREYMADYSSAQIIGNPNTLCSALVKISYGLAHTSVRPPVTKPQPQSQPYPVPPPQRSPMPAPQYASAYGVTPINQDMDKAAMIAASFQKPVDPKIAERQQKKRQATLQSLGAFGIANAASMRAAVAWYAPNGSGNPDNFAQVARWELYNPWARIAELVSTHPLTAFRIKALQKMNRLFGLQDQFDFKKVQPAKYNAFLRDVLIVFLPIFALGLGIGFSSVMMKSATRPQQIMIPIIGFLAGCTVKLIWQYAVANAGRRKVLQLLSEVQVSHVNPKYVVVEGAFTGRLQVGMPWAKDFILQDETGYVACIYRQPFFLWEALFGWLTAPTLIGRPIRVHGWYRRFNSPYLEIDKIEMIDTREVKKAYHFPYLLGLYFLLLALATLMLVVWKA
jgi:Zn-dependent protease with chaperone function